MRRRGSLAPANAALHRAGSDEPRRNRAAPAGVAGGAGGTRRNFARGRPALYLAALWSASGRVERARCALRPPPAGVEAARTSCDAEKRACARVDLERRMAGAWTRKERLR